MFTVTRSATAMVALAVLLTACGGADGDVTTADTPTDAETTQPSSPEPTEPETDVSPSPEPSPEPTETPTSPPADNDSEETDPPASSDPGEPSTELTVRLDPGNGDVSEWTITCDPVGGTASDPEAACETLESLTPRDVAPVPKDANCTMQYGGPQTARVTGVWDGTKVDLSFSRQNGCEIARWDAMVPVLPSGDAASL
ncbi:MAG TPA: SSI family serine proteinase inhibitor [Jiangellaceae bacterium]